MKRKLFCDIIIAQEKKDVKQKYEKNHTANAWKALLKNVGYKEKKESL
ncbi:MAG: hypothetical protein IJA89_02155 [Clostridia bacterium]|nr:hypothetical protein [Clostridia bacterium]